MLTIWDKLSNTFRRLRWKLTLSYVAVTVGALLGVSNPDLIGDSMIGQPFDAGTIPGLKRPLQAALEREEDPEQLFATLDQDEKMVVAVPVLSEGENGGQVLGLIAETVKFLPTQSDVSPLAAKLGTYTFSCRYADGRSQPEIVLAVGPNFVGCR